MAKFSTREAAQKLGIGHSTLAHYVDAGKVPAPERIATGSRIVHVWTAEDIKQVRKLLPTIKNGRKTRYQKQNKQTETKTKKK
jgi:predicted DNA-binding transcriptional regulator AlpA